MSVKNKNIESRFSYTLNRLLKSMHKFVGAAQDPQEIIRRLKLYASSQAYKDWCNELALNITTQVNKGVSATWREASRKAGRGSALYTAILEELETPNGGVFYQIVRQNAELITTFPLEAAEDLTKYISERGIGGRRSSEIGAELLKKHPNITKEFSEKLPENILESEIQSRWKKRLQLIARTEVSKTQSALTQARASSLGLNWYIWRTSEDARVRSTHSFMEGVLVNWKDPPNPEKLDPKGSQEPYGNYHAGNTFNCRCYEEVIVNLNYVDFPARVYRNNHIAPMSRAAFEKIM